MGKFLLDPPNVQFGFLPNFLKDINFPDTNPGPFPFNVSVDVYWGYPLSDVGGGSDEGITPGTASFQFALCIYPAGKTPIINDDNSVDISDALSVDTGGSFEAHNAQQQVGKGVIEFGYMPAGSTTLSGSGTINGTTPDTNNQVFLVLLGAESGTLDSFAAWANYTAIATNIPEGTFYTYAGAQFGNPAYLAPSSITIGGPTPTCANSISCANNFDPPDGDPGDIGFSLFDDINVGFLATNPADADSQIL